MIFITFAGLACNCLGPSAVEVALVRGPVSCDDAPALAKNCMEVDCSARCRYAKELGLEVRASLVDEFGQELDYRSDGYYCDGSRDSTTRTAIVELRFIQVEDDVANRARGAVCSWASIK